MPKQTTDKKEKKENRLVRYLKGVRAEMRKVTWPSREVTLRLTGIVLAVTFGMSAVLGLVDWVFAKLIALLIS
ncbi:MAG: preprotein translocase subunit SecE [Anaerolineales bacterium]